MGREFLYWDQATVFDNTTILLAGNSGLSHKLLYGLATVVYNQTTLRAGNSGLPHIQTILRAGKSATQWPVVRPNRVEGCLELCEYIRQVMQGKLWKVKQSFPMGHPTSPPLPPPPHHIRHYYIQ